MEKTTPLSDIKADLEAIKQLEPKTDEDIREMLDKLNSTFILTVEQLNKIFDEQI